MTKTHSAFRGRTARFFTLPSSWQICGFAFLKRRLRSTTALVSGRSGPALRALLLGTGLSTLATAAHADTTYWVNPGIGDWAVGANWDSGVPFPSDSANVDDGTALVGGGDLGSTGSLRVGGDAATTGTVTVDGAGSTLWINTSAWIGYIGTGVLNVTNGGLVDATGLDIYVGGNTYTLGDNSDSDGTINIDGAASTLSAHDIVLGEEGPGRLNISNGGTANTDGDAVFGTYADGSGFASVDGAGSNWNVGGNIYVALEGEGELTLSDGGVLTANSGTGTVYVASNSGSTGTINIGAAAGDAAVAAGSLDADIITFGIGDGTLNFNHTETDYDFTADISGPPIGYGTITLMGGTTGFSGDMSGYYGTLEIYGGTLSVADGETVHNRTGFVGIGVGDTGTALVDGSTASWTSTSYLHVGDYGTGNVTVGNGGYLSSTDAYLGYQASGDGTVTVTGAGSGWDVDGLLHVGFSGTGELNIADGGAVMVDGGSGTVHLAENSGTTATLNIGAAAGDTATGAGTLNAASVIFGDGSGTVVFNHTNTAYSFGANISGAGDVEAHSGTTTLAGNNTYTGSTTIFGGTLSVTGNTTGTDTVAVEDGALIVQSGGTLSNDTGFVGNTAGTTGTAAVTGAGSNWTNSTELYVGYAGNGALVVSDGGAVTDTSGYIGYNVSSTGAATVTGTGSSWDNSSVYYVGFMGAGELTVSDGGTVTNTTGYIGYNVSSMGTATVTGTGSNWTNSSNLFIGRSGTGELIVSDGGTVTDATGYIGYTSGSTGTATVTGVGAQWINSSAISVGRDGAGSLTISDGGTVQSGNISFIGYGAGSSGDVTVTGTGSVWSNSGDIFVGNNGGGTLTLSDGGSVNVNSGTGTVQLAVNAGATGTLNIGAAIGDAATAAGIVNASGVTFGPGTGTISFNHTETDYDFDPILSGSGILNHWAGTTNLTANNSFFTGTTNIFGGLLNVDSSLGGITNVNGGVLGGSGSLAMLAVNDGGTLAPGHSVGTLNVGDASFLAGSVYEVELNGGGFAAGVNNDFLNAFGTITITGGTVNVLVENGSDNGSTYSLGTYTIASAAGGVTGAFDGVTDDYLFLDFLLGYDASNIYLTSERAAYFSDMADTDNQGAVAGAADDMSTGDPIFDALLGLSTEDQARAAYDALSGEGHATLATVFLRDSRYVREAMLEQGAARGACGDWASAHGAYSKADSDGNAAAADSITTGLVVGADRCVNNAWLGASVHLGTTSLDIDDRATMADGVDLGAGLYGGAALGGTDFSFGAAYTRHYISTERAIAFGGVRETPSADYEAGTVQIFGEAARDFDWDGMQITPFARAAYIHNRTEGFSESGGDTALTVAGETNTATLGTLGVRSAHEFAYSNGDTATVSGTIGWRHAFDDDAPSINTAFEGSSRFAVAGVPLTRDALVLGARASLNIGASATLDLSYSGEFSGSTDDHAFSLTFRQTF